MPQQLAVVVDDPAVDLATCPVQIVIVDSSLDNVDWESADLSIEIEI